MPSPESFITLLGGFPEKPTLNIQDLRVEQADGYTRKLIEYTALDGVRVQAFLLVPHGQERQYPGVLAIHQDGAERPYHTGKSEPAGLRGDPDLHYGLELCLRGCVVLCPDRGGFESRETPPAAMPEPFLNFRIFTEDGLELTEDLYGGCLANRALFHGEPSSGGLFEMHRAVDCLLAQPEVDGSRVGVIGHSAGGWLSALLMYTDPRVKAGVTSCGTWLWRWNWGYEGTLRPINGFGGAVVPGLGKWGDQDDILAGIAPRPYMETRGDAGSGEAIEELTRKARLRYAGLGVPDRFEYIAYDSGHTFRRDMRERSYNWLDRWLGGEGQGG